jgi:hypothetical protein
MKAAALLFGLACASFGQVSSSSIYGEVQDETGRVITGARLTARSTGTGFVRNTISGEAGTYRMDALLPGTYSITVEKGGFEAFDASGVVLEVNQQARLDVRLKVGAAHESVTVGAPVSRLQSENSTIGFSISPEMIEELPLDERNIMSLITLGPGAVPRQLGGFVHDTDNDLQQGTRGSVAFNDPINGSRPYMNRYILDGGYDTDGNTFAIVVTPPTESVQEFHVQSSAAAPDFTQAGGGVIDVVTKSGTRDLHGSAFEYLRNGDTDARNYFDDPSLPAPLYRRNQFGGALGGPMAKSTFFFFTYEGLRDTFDNPALELVPDQAYRSGDFAGDSIIYNPLSLNPATGMRQPFAENAIPASILDPIAQKYLAEFEPLPNRPGASSNYVDTTDSTNDNHSGSGRIDHQFHNGSTLFGRYTINDELGGIAGNFPLRPTSEQLRAQQAVLGYTFSGTAWINDTRLSFNRLRLFDLPLNPGGQNVSANLGITGAPTNPFEFGLPYFLVDDFSTVTDDPTLPQIQRDNTWNLSDTVSLTRGRHTWKFGADWIHFQFNYEQSNDVRGQYTYTGAFTENNGDPSTGDAFADFLLGYPQQTQRTVGEAEAYLRQTDYGAFVEHDWQITSRLTLNMGVRYEYFSPYTETRGRMLNLDYSTLPNQPALVPVTDSTAPNYLNFAPRAGLAWRLPDIFGQTLVFRAGYGIYYSPEIAVEAYDLVLNNLTTENNSTSGSAPPILTTANGFPSSSSTGFPSYYGLDMHAPTPYVQQWNGGFQSTLPADIVFEASYAGSKGTDLGLFRRFNTALHTETGQNLPPRPGDLQSLRTFPDLGVIIQRQHIANSSFNALELKAEKRMRKSLSFLASFVWSKSLDDADDENIGLFDSVGAQNEGNLHLERGLSFFNVGRRFTGGVVYDLPTEPRLRPLTRNWQLSSVFTFQDGTPLDPFYFSEDIANSGTPNRPNLVPGQSINLPASQRTPNEWFNTAAFSTPAPYTFGDAGRDIIPGPGNAVVDLALHRRFALAERVSLELRAEAFNSLNNPNFGLPGNNPDFGPFFGKIRTAGDPRRFQFAARIEF